MSKGLPIETQNPHIEHAHEVHKANIVEHTECVHYATTVNHTDKVLNKTYNTPLKYMHEDVYGQSFTKLKSMFENNEVDDNTLFTSCFEDKSAIDTGYAGQITINGVVYDIPSYGLMLYQGGCLYDLFKCVDSGYDAVQPMSPTSLRQAKYCLPKYAVPSDEGKVLKIVNGLPSWV